MFSVKRVARFFLAGGSSLVLDLALQWVLIQLAELPVWLASGMSYEGALLAHFLVNDRWVFGRQQSSWRRLAQFQLTALTATAITYGVTNLLVYGPTSLYFAGGAGPYVAKVIGTGLAAAWTFTSSFFWIWRSPRRGQHAAGDPAMLRSGTGFTPPRSYEPGDG